MVERVSEQVFIPLTVGGGVRTVEDVRKLLNAGADKVSMNTAAVQNPDAFAAATAAFGNQCLVIAIDARRISPDSPMADPLLLADGHPGRGALAVGPDSQWEVYVHGGRTPTGIDAVRWAVYAAELGAGEVLLTSMDADGHQDGYDLELTRAVADAVPVPVIASGGAGCIEHLAQAVTDGHADAALAASIFHYGQHTIAEVKRSLAAQGIPAREVH